MAVSNYGVASLLKKEQGVSVVGKVAFFSSYAAVQKLTTKRTKNNYFYIFNEHLYKYENAHF